MAAERLSIDPEQSVSVPTLSAQPTEGRTMTTNRQPQGVMWVCVGCLFAREGDGTDPCGCTPPCEPWSLPPDYDVTLGLDCGIPDHWSDDPDAHSEQCETRDFVTSPCDGCGCPLGGTRHAYTWWE